MPRRRHQPVSMRSGPQWRWTSCGVLLNVKRSGGPSGANAGGGRGGIRPAVPPLQAFQDQVVARLQRQVEMRHQARFVFDQAQQVVVDFDAINRGDAKARQFRYLGE